MSLLKVNKGLNVVNAPFGAVLQCEACVLPRSCVQA
jgi:hypothetical protein